MKKNIALLLGLTLGFTAISCSLPFSRAAAAEETNKVTMYRLYNPNSGEHFYTCDGGEKTNLVNLGWRDEGIGWIAPATSNTPVFRLYNGNSGDHHYTLDMKEKNFLVGEGWKYEGIGWYSDDNKTVPLYREYNPNALTGTHNYTADKAEHSRLIAAGWKDEGIGWYAVEKKAVAVGDTVVFGSYEQDNNYSNGKEAIEWKVLAKEGSKALLISRYALDCQPYNTTDTSVTWETCSLRKWLNGEFFTNAFSSGEQNMIQTTTVIADMNTSYGTLAGNNTTDKVFLLSVPEVNRYFSSNEARKCAPTEYAKAQRVYTGEYRGCFVDGKPTCWWWLRLPEYFSIDPEGVYRDAGAYVGGDYVRLSLVGVRPTLWINLGSQEHQNGAAVGDIVRLGAYEQDNNSSNGKEEIEWEVLAKEGDKALVISKYALDCQPYNTTFTSVTWETCSLRKWLNETFLSNAFSTAEQNKIQSTTVTADKNPLSSVSPGNNTIDKVFLLSIQEANKYFSSDNARMCAPTEYAKARGAETIDYYSENGKSACWWWLRSPGDDSISAAYVYDSGHIDDIGSIVSDGTYGVRPAMWISLGS